MFVKEISTFKTKSKKKKEQTNRLLVDTSINAGKPVFFFFFPKSRCN